MASFKKSPIAKYSRVKNDLAELQRWWPAFIRDDGVLGITVDPVLFRTQFGSNGPTSNDDESTHAGIRVEVINDDGTTIAYGAGGEPTILISGSGTFNPRCTINHTDGTSTVILLVAPTEGQTTTPMNYTDTNGDSQFGNRQPLNASGGHKSPRGGPFPVFMTVQELVELIDSYRHIGNLDSDKPAWLPHNFVSGGSFHQLPNIDADPRIAGNNPLPATSLYRATVFMPMLLDNNQFSKDITGSTTLYAQGTQWNKNGITRYDSDPQGTDSATIKYKRVGNSGDHQLNQNLASATSSFADVTHDLKAGWSSQDSTDSPAPKYRMAMSLACFLKDGTYSLNNGTLIPYVYDAGRTFGGITTDTMYMRWDAGIGYGQGADDLAHEKPAGVYPLFDFVQGPITPRGQGSNWTHAVLADHTQTNYPLRYELPPNIQRNSVDYIEVVVVGGFKVLRIMVDAPATNTIGGEPNGSVQCEVGDAIFLSGMDGVLGSGVDMTLETGNVWPSRYDSRRPDVADTLDCNGWWIISKVETSTPAVGQTQYSFNVRHLPTTGGYNPSGHFCMGRVGGPEIAFNTHYAEYNDGVVRLASLEDGLGVGRIASGAKNPYLPSTNFTLPNGQPATTAIGTGYQAGMSQGDLNVPVASSRNDTAPARPTIGDRSIITASGDYIGNKPTPRSISIQTLGVTPAENIPTSPPIVASGNGSLRIPAPLGHDLSTRYESTGADGTPITSNGGILNNENTLWRVRSDIDMHEDSLNGVSMRGGPDKWAWRGVSTPLWSYIDGNTGRHAWDYIKPIGVTTTWTHGRNRSWPAHERMGTRLSMSPSLLPNATGWTSASGNLVEPATETTKIGLSEIGCSPIFLDIEMTAFIPNKPNRLSIIEFDTNDADDLLGRHHMIYNTDNLDNGFGFVPNWDGAGEAGVYFRSGFTDINGVEISFSNNNLLTSQMIGDAIDINNYNPPAATGGNVNFAGFSVDTKKTLKGDQSLITDGILAPYPSSVTNNRAAIWFMGSAPHWTGTAWTNSDTFTPPTAGFGRMGTGFGQGPNFAYSEGINTIRSSFTKGGMSLSFNGSVIGTDASAQEPVWGFQIKACNVFALTDRRPFFTKGTDKVWPQFSHLTTEEPLVVGIVHSATFATSRCPIDREYVLAGGGIFATMTDYYPAQMPVSPLGFLDSGTRMTRPDNPAFQTSNVDLQIDEMKLRQIPTPAMLPFTVDTLPQKATGIELARYTELLIEADNIDVAKRNFITVTLMEPPTNVTIAQEATTVIAGFDNMDLDFIGGVGAVDLTGLPATALANGFVVRFNFFIPDSTYPELHPIDWQKVPIIRSYTTYYDHKPTADGTIMGNTYNGSSATTVGQSVTQNFTTKIGHIVSLRMIGDTTDPDRKIAKVKADFGDGTITDWIDIKTPTASVFSDISHVYSARPASPYKYTIKVYSMDDVGNISSASTPDLDVEIVAAEPVGILKAVPSMVRAGQAIRLDGSGSYSVDTQHTIVSYAWTFGDGSSGVTGSALHQDHTYSAAGEYMATLIVTDTQGTVSPASKAVVKVLPATLVVPLNLSTKPSKFSRTRSANLTSTPILDAVYPEVSDMGTRGDQFTLSGMFLKATQDTDIAFMEELLLSGALVEFEYQEVNYVGVADSKTFTGRMTSFDYNRQGGTVDSTPYSATFIREAGLGV